MSTTKILNKKWEFSLKILKFKSSFLYLRSKSNMFDVFDETLQLLYETFFFKCLIFEMLNRLIFFAHPRAHAHTDVWICTYLFIYYIHTI